MDWIRITVKTTTPGSDLVGEILSAVSPAGVIIEDKADILSFEQNKEQWDYVDEHLADGYEDEVCVRGFVGEENDPESALLYVCEQLSQARNNNPDFPFGSLTVLSEFIKDENWSEMWKQYYKPFKPAEKIVIKPSWEQYTPVGDDLVLELDPGAAFGTGSHETTSMCIGFLEKYVTKDMSVMDVGCGTGILAMCACLLGARKTLAVDIDPSAVKVAAENIRMAGMDISVSCGNLLADRLETVDLIVANIIADAVKILAPGAYDHLTPNGIYITSGIINERAGEVEAAITAAGFKKLEKMTKGEWTAFVWEKL